MKYHSDMREVDKLREDSKIVEQRQTALFVSFVKQQRERFDFAEVSHHLAYEKNLEDTMIINDALTNWSTNPKLDADRKKELNGLLFSLWRVMAYYTNLETIVKTAVSKYVTTEKQNSKLVSEKRMLELQLQKKDKQIEQLQKEIEFLSK